VKNAALSSNLRIKQKFPVSTINSKTIMTKLDEDNLQEMVRLQKKKEINNMLIMEDFDKKVG
jgi:ABC-type uncharacterized transport system permease subunit